MLTPIQALRAIKARIEGDYDQPDLVSVGALHTDPLDDVVMILGLVDPVARDRSGHIVGRNRL